jgi:hypothetical protein
VIFHCRLVTNLIEEEQEQTTKDAKDTKTTETKKREGESFAETFQPDQWGGTHGWHGNTTDENWVINFQSAWQPVRGIAKPSVGIIPITLSAIQKETASVVLET